MLHRFACTVPSEDEGSRLDAFVGRWLPGVIGRPLSKSAMRKLVIAGAVRVNGRVTPRPGLPLAAGDRMEADVDTGRLERRRDPLPLLVLQVLYEEEGLLAINKPAGVVMHATADAGRDDLYGSVRRLLAAREGRGGDLPYLGLHHRLDVDTSGVVLFTTQKRANHGLGEQFAAGTVAKVYHAIARRPAGRLPRRWTSDDRLAPRGSGRSARMWPVPSGGVAASTEFALLDVLPRAILVEASPRTGRKHQIRAHLAARGAPLAGDGRYGGPMRIGVCGMPRVMLHAARVSLRHPVSGQPLTIECPYPDDFTEVLRCLRAQSVPDAGARYNLGR